MGRRQTGLTKRRQIWYIDKQIKGYGRLFESTKTSDREIAEDYLAARVAEIRRGIVHGVQLDRTFAQAAAKYLWEMSHINTIEETIRCTDWLVGELGTMRLIHITPAVVDQLISKRQRMGNANATVNRIMEKLRAILVKSVAWQWIASTPKIRMLPEPKHRVRWLSREEADRLLTELPPHLRAMAQFTLATGLRESNVTGLEWSQVNLERRVAWIHPDQSKNSQAISVPLNPEAVVVLRGEQEKHVRWVFTYSGHRRKERTRVARCNNTAWSKALERAGVENFRWHDLRHTWASWHVMAGTPLHVLQQLGGWSSYEMVLRYAHLSAEHLAAYADAISKPREAFSHVKSHVS